MVSLSMGDGVKVIGSDSAFTTVVYQNIALTMWHGRISVEGIAASSQGFHVAAQFGKPPILVSVVEKLSGPPNEEVRRAIVKTMRASEQVNPLAAVIVLEGHGMVMTAARTIVTGLVLAARQVYPVQCFATIDLAAAWLEKISGSTSSVGQATKALTAHVRPPRQHTATA